MLLFIKLIIGGKTIKCTKSMIRSEVLSLSGII